MAAYNLALELAEASQLVGSLCSEESGAQAPAVAARTRTTSSSLQPAGGSNSNDADSPLLPSAHDRLEKAQRFCVRALELDRSNVFAAHLYALILSASSRLEASGSLEKALAVIDTAISECSTSNIHISNLQYVLFSKFNH